MGTLYIVPTPIGNLQDITFRAIEILKKVDVVACEDTRRTGQLLKLLDIKSSATLISYYDQNELFRVPKIINALKNNLSVALVSDAGTPLISDPGFKLIRECAKLNILIESLPGASSVITALTLSGLPTDKFLFLGYPPQKSGHRKTFFENIRKTQMILSSSAILFEAPHKMLTTLSDMKESFGDIQVVVCRELTKIHQEVRREKISQVITHYSKVAPKGEIVILFNLSKQSLF